MSLQLRKRLFNTTLCIGLLIVLSASSSQQIRAADPPSGVVRRFLVFSNQVSQLPNFRSANSRLVIVPGSTNNNRPQNSISFDDSFPFFQSCEPSLDGTSWVFQDVFHIGRGRQILTVAFEDGIPPTGSRTLTGPNSPYILEVKQLWVENGFQTGRIRPRCVAGGSGAVLVVTAVFSR